MTHTVDEAQVRTLIANGISQREIAKRLNIPRTTLQKMIKALGQAPAAVGVTTRATDGVPVVDTGTLTAEEIEVVRAEFWELIDWWRERKVQRVYASTPRETLRQTYHVEKPFIGLIHREAESEGISIRRLAKITWPFLRSTCYDQLYAEPNDTGHRSEVCHP